MNLDQMLGGMTVEQLQDLMGLWAPDEPTSRSKLVLFRTLREQMTGAERARHSLEAAEPLGRGIVRKLLRSAGASQSVAVLAAGSASRPRSVQETRTAIGTLASMGLVSVEPEKRWETYGSALVTIPVELVEPLRAAAGIDSRSWQEILSLAGHVAAAGPEEAAKRAMRVGVRLNAKAPLAEVVSRLAEPECCARRVDALPAPLREAVLGAVRLRGGIVPVDRLREELGRSVPKPAEPELAEWRSEMEAHLVGTVGDISLLEYGIDLDGKTLVVFSEVAEALLSRPCGEHKVMDPVGPDFLLDLLELVSMAREWGAKLKASGELTGAASQRILSKLNRPTLPHMDTQELLELRLACAEKLGLVERGGETLEVGPSAREWEGRRFEEKAAGLFGLIGFAAPTPRSKHHHEGLCGIARELLRAMRPGEWRAAGALAHITVRRYLDRLEAAGLREKISEAVQRVPEYVLPPFPGLPHLAGDVHDAVVKEAYAMGVLELAAAEGGVVAESLSDFGAIAGGGEAPERGPGQLIATPDFEVIILPEGDTVRLRYEVGQFALREKFEQTYHLRIKRERVEEAVVRGATAEEMAGLLRSHSEAGAVPQNVEYSIREWAERVRVATVEGVHVFELGDEKLLSVVAELPEVKRVVLRRLSPTALALSEWPGDRKLLADLRRLGVHVR